MIKGLLAIPLIAFCFLLALIMTIHQACTDVRNGVWSKHVRNSATTFSKSIGEIKPLTLPGPQAKMERK